MFMYEFKTTTGRVVKTNTLTLTSDENGNGPKINGMLVSHNTYARVSREMTDNLALVLQKLEADGYEDLLIITEPCLGTDFHGQQVLIVPNDSEDASDYPWKCIRSDGFVLFACDSKMVSNHNYNHIVSITALSEVNIEKSCIGYTREGIEVLITSRKLSGTSISWKWQYYNMRSRVCIAVTTQGKSYETKETQHDIIYTRPATIEDFQHHLN